jgi:hypothetical protein
LGRKPLNREQSPTQKWSLLNTEMLSSFILFFAECSPFLLNCDRTSATNGLYEKGTKSGLTSLNIIHQYRFAQLPKPLQFLHITQQYRSAQLPKPLQSLHITQQYRSAQLPKPLQFLHITQQYRSAQLPKPLQSLYIRHQYRSAQLPKPLQSLHITQQYRSAQLPKPLQSLHTAMLSYPNPYSRSSSSYPITTHSQKPISDITAVQCGPAQCWRFVDLNNCKCSSSLAMEGLTQTCHCVNVSNSTRQLADNSVAKFKIHIYILVYLLTSMNNSVSLCACAGVCT